MLARAQITICNEKDWEVSATASINPALETLWMDTSVTPHTMKRWNGSAWVTKGQVLVHSGKLLDCFYSASNKGITKRSGDLWSKH